MAIQPRVTDLGGTSRAAAAVATLHAAGDDIDALTEAIEQSAFLMDKPGEDRQKLRGAWVGG